MSCRIEHIILIFSCLFIISCSTTRYVPENDFLYKGAKVKVKSKEVSSSKEKALSEEMENILRPKPNKEFLGIPFKLMIYSFWGKPGKYNGLGNWISRKAGEEPVLFSEVSTDYQEQLLTNRLENRGYFNPEVEMDSSSTKKKIKLRYTIDPGRQYLIDTVYFPDDSSVLAKEIFAISDNSFLDIGEPFDLDVIKAERERINARLKEQGFYYFSPDYLQVLVDSTEKPYSVILFLDIKYDIPARTKEKFTIDDIYVFPHHSLQGDTLVSNDTIQYNDLTIVGPTGAFRSSVFEETLKFEKGDLYNRSDHNKSLNRLIDIGVFKYVENRFRDKGNSTLDAYYYLTPFAKKSLRLELTGRNTSTNFTGAELNLSWRNRNTFRGAENLRFSIYGGADVQISGINQGNNLYRYGAEVDLNIPRFITPFSTTTPSAFIPRTTFSIGFDRLNRVSSYALNSLRGSFGYRWKENVRKEHQLSVFSMNYIQPSYVSPEYRERMEDDPSLARAIERQFIIGPIYNYTFTNTMEQNRKHTFYYNSNLDLSGNIIGLISGADFRDGEPQKIFSAEFSQYVRLEQDFRHYNSLGKGSVFASRLFVGFGYAYGNSSSLPFIKQFFAGGTASLRAFRARTLGPGSYRAENIGESGVIATDQTGDIKLEVNFEYRPQISGILEGALFVDAGNIWLLREDTMRLGAEFGKDFLRETAVGFGFGLRFDFSFFVLRTDLAFPLRKPWLPEGERWVIDKIAPGRREWRRENLVLSLAIGYPF